MRRAAVHAPPAPECSPRSSAQSVGSQTDREPPCRRRLTPAWLDWMAAAESTSPSAVEDFFNLLWCEAQWRKRKAVPAIAERLHGQIVAKTFFCIEVTKVAVSYRISNEYSSSILPDR